MGVTGFFHAGVTVKDMDGRVLAANGDGAPIEGLYAAGNVAASLCGFAYPGAGGTLGPVLTFGLRAGAAAAADR
jgi:3-oxosteroid 1-dehydrogenase